VVHSAETTGSCCTFAEGKTAAVRRRARGWHNNARRPENTTLWYLDDPVLNSAVTGACRRDLGDNGGHRTSLGSWPRSGCGTDPSCHRGCGAAQQRADGHAHEDVARVVNAGVDAGERDHRRGHAQRHPHRGKSIPD
jgi:hypothetical protein